MSNRQLHDEDFYAWANGQAGLLRAGRLSEADIEPIAEPIESMGKSEKREFVNRLTVLLVHLLMGRHQPFHRCKNWRLTLEKQRNRPEDHMGDNPNLKFVLERRSWRRIVMLYWRRVRRQAWNAPCFLSPARGVSSR